MSLSRACEAGLTSGCQPESRDSRVREELAVDGAREGVVSKNSSALRSALTPVSRALDNDRRYHRPLTGTGGFREERKLVAP
jgi:hypothetical protein